MNINMKINQILITWKTKVNGPLKMFISFLVLKIGVLHSIEILQIWFGNPLIGACMPRIQTPQQTLSTSAGQWCHHRGHSTTCLDCRPCSSTITWADRGSMSSSAVPILTPDPGSVAASWTSMHQTLMPQSPLVSVSHSGAQRSPATNFPRGLGGRKRDQENLSICHQQVQQSFCIALAIEEFLQSLPILTSADKTAWRLSYSTHPKPGPQHPMQPGPCVHL